MALRVAAGLMARSVSASAPAVFVRGFASNVDKFTGGQPIQSKRPAYDDNDPPHTEKWLQVRALAPARRKRSSTPFQSLTCAVAYGSFSEDAPLRPPRPTRTTALVRNAYNSGTTRVDSIHPWGENVNPRCGVESRVR